jgi:hypothetical protein
LLSLEPTKATVILSDIRLPLIWTKMKKFKTGSIEDSIDIFIEFSNNLEQKKFAIFCLARIGYEIIDTQMKFIDKQSTDILFTDKLTL